MNTTADARSAVPQIILSRDAEAHGLGYPLRSRIGEGRLTLIRRGAYIEPQSAEERTDTFRYLSKVLAVLALRPDAVVTSYSAAILLGLPMIGPWPNSVYLLSSTTSGRRRNGVVELARHGHERLIEADGRAMTSIPHTLIHICRTARFVSALAIVDAAVHVDRFDRIPPLASLEELHDCVDSSLPFPGSIRTKRILANATTLADNSFETLSRVVIDELGFPQPVLQHKLYLPRSDREVYGDFAWLDYHLIGEADGRGKYLGSESEPLRDPAQTVIAEKKREDEIRALRWSVARWDWGDALRQEPLRAILIEAGLPLVRRKRSFR